MRHGQSFRANDCLSKLIKNIVETKFSSARTKSPAIICNVLAPHVMTKVIEDLLEAKSFLTHPTKKISNFFQLS